VADHRRFLYGLVGPEVSELTYRHRRRVRPVPLSEPEGAYLVVLAERQRGGGAAVGRSPSMGHPFVRLTYRDGTSCPPPGAKGTARQCDPSGYRSLLAGLEPESLRRPLRAALSGRRLVVSFRAPVGIDDARLSYGATAHFDRRCPQIYFVPSTNRDVRRGAPVTLEMELPPRCHGTIRGVVRLSVNATGPPVPMGGGESITIGRFVRRDGTKRSTQQDYLGGN
jgi:hypothetical protein